MITIKANLYQVDDETLKKIALAVFLGVNCDEIVSDHNDYFSINPRKVKTGNSPAYYVRLALALQAGLMEFYTYHGETWQELIKAAGDGKAAYDHLYIASRDKWNDRFAPSGSIHYYANGLYHLLSSAPDDQSWHVYALRAAFNGEEIEDRREYRHAEDGEYLVLTEEEADERAEEYVRSVFEDCYLPDLPKDNFLMQYIDLDKAVEDAIEIDGRAHSLAGYDGEENEVYFDNADYPVLYIYRTN